MAGSESILPGLLFEEETLDDIDEDVDMLDAEIDEPEPVIPQAESMGSLNEDGITDKQEPRGVKNLKWKEKRKKKKKKKRVSSNTVTDINRFVSDTCRHLKERKSYLIWNAVGCLGISAMRELVKEVDTIQNCGGQLTADGKRSRNGGGILWNILKTREPNTYKEIMKKGREFEKQFRQQYTRGGPKENREHCPVTVVANDKISSVMRKKMQPNLEPGAVSCSLFLVYRKKGDGGSTVLYNGATSVVKEDWRSTFGVCHFIPIKSHVQFPLHSPKEMDRSTLQGF
ncbi:hypothetical protein H6P81_008514 [Aristolochia fimbriata]|uniref:Phosphorylated adapter RNA export protein n=1 Tax=Aristolochia fimbriata TaxID=158543 RepID=A0AAV7EIX1_ARIFI|nr:hypothetical protein H6P81_008514 [Aristolochia fimbriata]